MIDSSYVISLSYWIHILVLSTRNIFVQKHTMSEHGKEKPIWVSMNTHISALICFTTQVITTSTIIDCPSG